MNSQSEQNERELDEVIEAYVQAAPGSGYNTLREWASEYPQHAEELADFSVAWGMVLAARPTTEEMASEDVSEAVQRHLAAIRQIAVKKEGIALKGIISEGQAAGISTMQLAKAVGLSVPLITKLDRRIIRFASVPGEVIERIASVLGREAATVRRYLQGGPMLAPNASYKADEAPSLPAQEEFAHAVKADRTLSDEQRKRLLGMG